MQMSENVKVSCLDIIYIHAAITAMAMIWKEIYKWTSFASLIKIQSSYKNIQYLTLERNVRSKNQINVCPGQEMIISWFYQEYKKIENELHYD